MRTFRVYLDAKFRLGGLAMKEYYTIILDGSRLKCIINCLIYTSILC